MDAPPSFGSPSPAPPALDAASDGSSADGAPVARPPIGVSPFPFPPADAGHGGGSTAPTRPTHAQSVGAFVLGVLAVIGAAWGGGLLFGIPAIVLGISAHRNIDARSGVERRRGRGLANAAIVLGVTGSLLFFAWASLALMLLVRSGIASAEPPMPVLDPPFRAWPTGAPALSPPSLRESARTLVVHRSGGPLRGQLASLATSAGATGETILVVTFAPECDACDQIEHAMEESPVRAALARVRVVQVDVSEFRSELGRLRMDETTAPWFYLVDRYGEPQDAIDADEWNDNVADNIAPVLQAFVTGKLRSRHHEWHGGATL